MKAYILLYKLAESPGIFRKDTEEYPQDIIDVIYEGPHVSENYEEGSGIISWALYERLSSGFYQCVGSEAYIKLDLDDFEYYIRDKVDNTFRDDDDFEEIRDKWTHFTKSNIGATTLAKYAHIAFIKAVSLGHIKMVFEVGDINEENNILKSAEVIDSGSTTNTLWAIVNLVESVNALLLKKMSDIQVLVTIEQPLLQLNGDPVEIIDDTDAWSAPINKMKTKAIY
jgi:hypothetical protein